jgi:hypothetical protein
VRIKALVEKGMPNSETARLYDQKEEANSLERQTVKIGK